MGKSFTIQLNGFKQIENRLKQLPKEVKEEIGEEIESSLGKVVSQQKQNAPKNLGGIVQSIGFSKDSELNYTNFANSKYAHIMEFGSKKKVKVPSNLANYASQFKGKPSGGSFDEFVKSLEKWVKRKGIGVTYNVSTRRKNRQSKDSIKQAALTIARSIAKNGVSPKPFFFDPLLKEIPNLRKNIERVLNDIK